MIRGAHGWVVFLILTALAAHAPAPAATFNVTVPPRQQDAYENAHYRLWLPDGIQHVRGVIVRQHGCGPGARQLGLEHADDPQWQALARKWDCALLGTQLWAPKEDCSTWTMPADGSDHAFLTALHELAKLSGHAELEQAPWALWGHSGGAIWVTNMTYRHPERVLATFPRSGGLSPANAKFARSSPPPADSVPAAFRVPILFCFGQKEAQEGSRFKGAPISTYNVFNVGRAHGALWAIAVHPGVEHENGNSRLIAIRFFDAVLAKRLPDRVPDDHPPRLKPMDAAAGWSVDLSSHDIGPVVGAADKEASKADPKATGWLPDKATAQAWHEFVTTGFIKDTTPPPAPTTVKLGASADAVTLTWHALADVESGIGSFRIYRDGRMIGQVAGSVDKRWNPNGFYHAWNYSDQPLAGTKFPDMRYDDKSDGRSAAAGYQVTTVNQSGLESAKADASR
jgi:predicted esterase